MFVTTAPETVPDPEPATDAGTVLLAVKAEVATPAAATATPASRTRDLRIAGVLFSQWLRAARTTSGGSDGCAFSLTPCLRPMARGYQLLSQKKLESLKRPLRDGHRWSRFALANRHTAR